LEVPARPASTVSESRHRWAAADYTQHSALAADGPDGFGAAAAKWAEQGKTLVYNTVHKVIAEGESDPTEAS
jgi:hypothetical protein